MSLTEKKKDTIQSVNKIPLVLDLFFSHSNLTLHEIHQHSGLLKTSALRLCNSLVNIGFLEKSNIGNTPYYRLGIELYKLGRLAVENISIHESAKKYLKYISQELGDSTYLFIERDNKAICLDNMMGSYYIQTLTINIGDILPFNKGGGPLVMLAFYPKAKQEKIIDAMNLSKREENALYERLESNYEKGYSLSIGEVYENTAAIGVPVFDIDGNVAGALSAGAIASRFSDERIPFIVETLKKSAKELTRDLGYGAK
ncbi:IclR family transcriptional regulator [Oceanobacillus sp. CF4.6]|uniref:IclR family transcriptional regulator n=1 Tax=Oceanobacillus sp. CF4.6 TaxID=3373080 RepID=UPI003EE45AD7